MWEQRSIRNAIVGFNVGLDGGRVLRWNVTGTAVMPNHAFQGTAGKLRMPFAPGFALHRVLNSNVTTRRERRLPMSGSEVGLPTPTTASGGC